jgi:hypothetical protein
MDMVAILLMDMVAILLMVIRGCSINGYGGYFINAY